MHKYRRSHQRCSVRKGVLRNFKKFTGKHLCQNLFSNKVAARPATSLKKRLWHRCFPVNFAKFLRTPFFIENLWWLLLQIFLSSVYWYNLFRWRFFLPCNNWKRFIVTVRFFSSLMLLLSLKQVFRRKYVLNVISKIAM